MLSNTARIGWTVALAVVAAIVRYVAGHALASWGILDPYAQSLGKWFKMNVTPEQAGWTAATLLALTLYGIALYFIWWRHSRSDSPRAAPTELPSQIFSKRIPLVTDFYNLAAKAGWSTNARAVTFGKNGPALLLRTLRQAAADGAMQLYGRKASEMPASLDSTPLVPIERDHFNHYEISPWGGNDKTVRDFHPHDPHGGFRDLHVNEQQAKDWLAGDGKPPEPASFAIRGVKGTAKVGEFETIIALEVTNIGGHDLDKCLVTIEQIRATANWETLHLALRTEGQIRGGRTGRFSLSKNQPKIVPMLFAHEPSWTIFGEQGDSHPVELPLELVIGVYGGETNGRLHVDLALINGGVFPKIESKPVDFVFPSDKEGSDVAR